MISVTSTVHVHKVILCIRILRSSIFLFFSSRVIFEEYVFDIELPAFPNLRHMRVETEDDIFESEYCERASLVIKRMPLGHLEADLLK